MQTVEIPKYRCESVVAWLRRLLALSVLAWLAGPARTVAQSQFEREGHLRVMTYKVNEGSYFQQVQGVTTQEQFLRGEGQILTSAQAQAPPRHIAPVPRVPRRPSLVRNPQVLHAEAPKLPASVTPDVIPATCPPEAVGAVCGYVKVPLDRGHPERVKIKIYFELYPHSASGRAESAILANFGGPGFSTTFFRGFAQFLFGSNLDVHDLLLIDHRGTGLSTAIDCKELQHGTEAFGESETDCAEQLGVAASQYGDGDIAKDADAVRAALGYGRRDRLRHPLRGTPALRHP
jgi:hypothetical protein